MIQMHRKYPHSELACPCQLTSTRENNGAEQQHLMPLHIKTVILSDANVSGRIASGVAGPELNVATAELITFLPDQDDRGLFCRG